MVSRYVGEFLAQGRIDSAQYVLEFLVFLFESGDLLVHRFEAGHDVVRYGLAGSAFADAEGYADISGRLLIAFEGRCAAQGQHDVAVEVIEAADSRCLRAVIGTHSRRNLELRACAVVIQRMEAGQGCGNRADAVDFIAQVGNPMSEGVDSLAVLSDSRRILFDSVVVAVYSVRKVRVFFTISIGAFQFRNIANGVGVFVDASDYIRCTVFDIFVTAVFIDTDFSFNAGNISFHTINIFINAIDLVSCRNILSVNL